jgi:hypothetical protein
MRIENIQLKLEVDRRTGWLENIANAFNELGHGVYPLRYSISHVEQETAVVEATTVTDPPPVYLEVLDDDLNLVNRKTHQADPFGIVQVVPTGIRCEFGGYAGDATPVTNLLATAVDFVVTHPNAVNASEINEMASNILYVEGKSLDDFMLGRVALGRVCGNPIGTCIDPTGTAYLDSVIHTLNAGRAVAGMDCGRYMVLKEAPGIEIGWNKSGSASGTVKNPGAILDGVESLLGDGATAVGCVSVIHGVTKDMSAAHMQGRIPNPSGAVEAIITHLISKVFRIPTAHAPLPYYLEVKHPTTTNPRASAEFISTPHYFCVLKGLHSAPRIIPVEAPESAPGDTLTVNNIGAVVIPASALGGIPALAAEFSGIPIIAVRENRTILDVTNAGMGMENVIGVESYLEAVGVISALKNGIYLDSLTRPLIRQPGLSDSEGD